MKKVCLVVQDSLRDIALNKLRELGVIHIETKDVPIDINSNAQRKKVKVEDAIGLIRSFKQPKIKTPKKSKTPDPDDSLPPEERRQKPVGLHRGRRATDIFGTEEEEPYSLSAVRAPARPKLSDYMLSIEKERKALIERDLFINHEIERIESWGDFDPEVIHEVSEGLPVFLYQVFHSDYEKLEEDVLYTKIKSIKDVDYIVVYGKELNGLTPVTLPDRRLSEYILESECLKKEIHDLEEEIKSLVSRRATLDREMIRVQEEIEFEEAMASVESANTGSDLAWLTGFLPADEIEKIKELAKENCWGLSVFDPSLEDEKVPTKLKNNKFVSLLTPITSFLGILPGYREVDISLSFLFFFCIFFAMIFGDAGYGSILVLTGIVLIIKTMISKKEVNQGLLLLLLLGIFNTAWGVITCSWFGVDADKAPEFLQNLSIAAISTAKTDRSIVNQNMQILCFSLALIHLSIAHFINAVRFKSLKSLAEIGSIGMLIGIYNVVLLLIVSTEARPIPLYDASKYLIGGGFLLNFLFSGYERSIGQSIKAGLSNTVMAVLGIINIFSDIMSYIRLWAVGLAGASIASTINLMAGPMLGGFIIFAGIILLVFGHGLNMVLNVLSVLVHGVRLNTLEFSGHVGISWSGKPYKPFMQRIIAKK